MLEPFRLKRFGESWRTGYSQLDAMMLDPVRPSDWRKGSSEEVYLKTADRNWNWIYP
jgi:hypothetical protein